MDIDKERYRLRLVMSYREKARNLLDKAATHAADTPTHRDRSRNLSTFYEQHLAAAELERNRIQAGLAAEREGLETAIAGVRKNLAAMAPKGTPGGRVARHTRQRNRKMADELDRLMRAHDDVSRLCVAQTAEALDGFIDLPVEEYEARLQQHGPSRKSRRALNQAGIVLALAVVVVAVGLWALQTAPTTRTASDNAPAPQPTDATIALGSGGTISVQTLIPRNVPGILYVALQNSDKGSASVYVPWPDGTPDPTAADFGFIVEIAQSEDDSFHLLPTMNTSWRYDNALLETPAHLFLVPDMTLPLQLDIAALRRQVGTLQRVRLLFTNGNGKTLQQIEFKAEDVLR